MATDLNVLCGLHEHVHHELPNVAGHHTACSKMCAASNQTATVVTRSLTLQHAEEEDKHFFLQAQQFTQKFHLTRVTIQLALQHREDV